MLDAMRKRASSWFVRALLLVLIVSFAVWGIGDMFIGRHDIQVAATVGDTEVPLRDVERAFENERQALQQQLGISLDRRQAASFGVLNRSLQNVVARALVDQHRRDLGLGVSDEEVAATIRNDPFFASAGSFDRFRLDSFLRSAGLSEAQYVEAVRSDIGRNRLLDALTDLVIVPAPLAERLAAYRGETRRGTVLVVPRTGIATGEPDEAALESLLEANTERFTAPEYRTVSLVTLTTDDIVDEIEIDEAVLRQEYEARLDFYTRPERRRVGQLLADDREVIEAARNALAEGAVFAELADTMTADGLTYSTLGPTTAADLPPEFAEPIFALDAGEVSGPIESLFGWHLFRVIEVEPEVVQDFAEVRDEIRRELALDRAIDQLPDLAAALDDGIAAGETLEAAAAAVGAEVQRFEAIDRQGQGPDGRPVAGGALEQEILATIFEAPVDEVSLLEETAAGGFFMFRVDAVEAPRPRRLDEVRDELAQLWRRERQTEIATERAREIMAEARAGRTLEALAAAREGGEVVLRSLEPVVRHASGSAVGLTEEAVAALFATPAGELAPEPVTTVEGVALLRTDEIIAADPAATTAVAEEIADALRGDILVQYEAALRARYPIEVNDAAIATLFPEDQL